MEPSKVTTRTANLTMPKILWNSVLSIEYAKYMCVDIEISYLVTLLDQFKYMKMPANHFPKHIIAQ